MQLRTQGGVSIQHAAKDSRRGGCIQHAAKDSRKGGCIQHAAKDSRRSGCIQHAARDSRRSECIQHAAKDSRRGGCIQHAAKDSRRVGVYNMQLRTQGEKMVTMFHFEAVHVVEIDKKYLDMFIYNCVRAFILWCAKKWCVLHPKSLK